MPTFAAYVEQEGARNALKVKIKEHTKDLTCRLLSSLPVKSQDRYRFYIKEGRKYLKVMMNSSCNLDKTVWQESVHCFVDKKTGEVYKAASINAPAKGVRYDLRLINDRNWLMENADWAGGYLYQDVVDRMRGGN